MRYVAMDFETGNASPLSACSVGISVFEDDHLKRQEVFLIKPPAEAGAFHWYNVKVNGIKRAMVANAPAFPAVWAQFAAEVEGAVVVCHNAMFDIGVLCACLQYYQLRMVSCQYVCTVKIAQKVWPALENHKLNTVSESLGIALNHHEAGSDAYACGMILQHALRTTGLPDVKALADAIGMQIGTVSPCGKTPCSVRRETTRNASEKLREHKKRR